MIIKYDKKKVEEIYKEIRSIPTTQEAYEKEHPIFTPSQVKGMIAYILTKFGKKK